MVKEGVWGEFKKQAEKKALSIWQMGLTHTLVMVISPVFNLI